MAAPAWYGVDAGLDLLASRLGGRRRAREVRACCPVHQGDNDAALQLRASGDRIVARCYTSGCHQGDGYADFARRLEEMTGVRLSEPPWERRPATRPPDRQHRPRERGAPPGKAQADMRAVALGIWGRTRPIPSAPTHPARLWLAARHLWRPGLPLPSSVRWLPGSRQHQGAGSLVAVLAPLSAWAAAWPDAPAPQSVQTVAVSADGSPSLDRPAHAEGLGKRTLGPASGGILLIGNPDLSWATEPVRVCEGLADALALGSRLEGPVLAGLGPPTRLAGDADLVSALAEVPFGLVIHADNDSSGTGQRSAAALRRAVHQAGGDARAATVREGKDPAALAAHLPFPDLDDAWVHHGSTLRTMYPEWPDWELARVASISTTEAIT